VPLRPTDLDARVRLVWKAVSWLQRGKIDPALGLLETLAGPDLDPWSAAVLLGTARLRDAAAQAARAAVLESRGDREAASFHWVQAEQTGSEALGDVRLELIHRSGGIVVALPDPWLHLVDGFQEHLDRERRRAREAAGFRHPAVLQFSRRGDADPSEETA
jgi:hypothetical protein